MENYCVYEDMLRRTGGDIYIGVVGPVRTGKSTFIRRFMERLVLPFADEPARTEMADELPQASSGRTIMTTEPKFVPAKAAEIVTPAGMKARVRLVDCVGYVVEGAVGFEEDGQPRLVETAWSDEPIPLAKAAEIGTEKVIKEHSTVGVLVTTDGSFTAIERAEYEKAEMRAAAELKALGKPFVIVLNCVNAASCEGLRSAMESRYGVPVVALNVETMDETGVLSVLQAALLEFPVRCVDIEFPAWLQALPESNPFVDGVMSALRGAVPSIKKMKDCVNLCSLFDADGDYLSPDGVDMDVGAGCAKARIGVKDGMFFRALSHECGVEITDDCALMMRLKALADDGKKYDKIRSAFEQAEETGYGIVAPSMEDLALEKPQVVKRGNNYGVRIAAGGTSYHILKIDVGGKVEPIVGDKAQGESFCASLVEHYADAPEKVWETNVFGNSVRQLMEGELAEKNKGVPEELKGRLRRTVCRIVNEGKSTLLCILL